MYRNQLRALEILLVEDNPADITLIREGLRESKAKHRLSVALDGEEALEFLRQEGKFEGAPRPDLILLDLNLPKRLGTEVLSVVKNDPELKRIPVLIYTSSLSENDVNKAYDFGANSYIRKPRELADLYDIVATLEHFWMDLALLPSSSPS
jgi:CheY-like chemotaxis protein